MGVCCTKCVREKMFDITETELKRGSGSDLACERAGKSNTNHETAVGSELIEFKTKAATLQSHVELVNVVQRSHD